MMKTFSPDNYSTVIFDLGQVIVDLDPKAVIEGLQRAGGLQDVDYRELIVSSPLLQLYETGKISEYQFRQGLLELLQIDLSDEAFDSIWNAMLGDIPLRRLNFMKQLGEDYKTMILSNTNGIHERKFDEMVGEVAGGSLMKDFVHHAYYSHDVGFRKPDPEIYQFVIDHGQLEPARTLFLDDRLDNVEAARVEGIHAVKVEFPDQIFEILAYD
ncbi:MAG: HAD family phosphatase [Bacteroidota bacterium]